MGAEVPRIILPALPGLVIPFQHPQEQGFAVPIALLGCPRIVTRQVLGPHDGSGIEPVDALEELGGGWPLPSRPSSMMECTGGSVLVEQDPKQTIILYVAPEDGGWGDHEVD